MRSSGCPPARWSGPDAHAGVDGCFESREHLKSDLILTFPGLQEFIPLECALRHSFLVPHALIEKLIKGGRNSPGLVLEDWQVDMTLPAVPSATRWNVVLPR